MCLHPPNAQRSAAQFPRNPLNSLQDNIAVQTSPKVSWPLLKFEHPYPSAVQGQVLSYTKSLATSLAMSLRHVRWVFYSVMNSANHILLWGNKPPPSLWIQSWNWRSRSGLFLQEKQTPLAPWVQPLVQETRGGSTMLFSLLHCEAQVLMHMPPMQEGPHTLAHNPPLPWHAYLVHVCIYHMGGSHQSGESTR
jgi:hypothetical protein